MLDGSKQQSDNAVITDPARLLPAHQHSWQPLVGWFARYRCTGCQSIGYKVDIVLGDDEYECGPRSKLRDWIRPYTCSVKGCQGWAVGKDWSSEKSKRKLGPRVWRCRWHRGLR